jgi:hypothetical protein
MGKIIYPIREKRDVKVESEVKNLGLACWEQIEKN